MPVARVQSTALTGRGCLRESEVILQGGPMRVHVFDTLTHDEDAIAQSLSATHALVNIDADLDDADWPKRTDDRRAALRVDLDAWDAGFVAADVTHGKIWAEYGISAGAEVPNSMYPDVSYSEVKSGCTIVWTLSISDPFPND